MSRADRHVTFEDMIDSMSPNESAAQADDDPETGAPQPAVSPRRVFPANAASMVQTLRATSEEFAYGNTALTAALNDRRLATVAARLTTSEVDVPGLSLWRCVYGERGI